MAVAYANDRQAPVPQCHMLILPCTAIVWTTKGNGVEGGCKVDAWVRPSAGDNAYVTAEGLKADLLRVQATNKAEVDLEHIQVKTIFLFLIFLLQMNLYLQKMEMNLI